ncbi:hypothetical protein ACLSZ3_02700 [Avibacterium gallinarum]|uniref:HEPN AbiU2-like domain-containing protein n=1 Tax=Avibacterium avium TaxID=751 RepID=A0A379AU43_AVIAV|nr:hypothetical protein [Avibacterium avium]SUB24851.1 Uncharacterised protein [Avibacterium avium]
MNKEIKSYIDVIGYNLKQADAAFRIYCALLKIRSTKSKIKWFNQTPYTFHHLTNITLYDSINTMYKITESEKQISFKKLRTYLDLDKNNENLIKINKIRVSIRKTLGKVQHIRVKLTAHLDEQAKNPSILLNEIERNEIRVLLDRLLELINIYKSIYSPESPDIFYDDKIDDELLRLFICLKQDKSYNYYEKLKKRLPYRNILSLLYKEIERQSSDNQYISEESTKIKKCGKKIINFFTALWP